MTNLFGLLVVVDCSGLLSSVRYLVGSGFVVSICVSVFFLVWCGFSRVIVCVFSMVSTTMFVKFFLMFGDFILSQWL